MKIAILGAGNAGCAAAADLTIKGHTVSLIKTSDSIHDDSYNVIVSNNNQITLSENNIDTVCKIQTVTRDISYVAAADVIIVFTQTNYHEALIERFKNYLCDGQIVLFNPGYLSTAYMLKHKTFDKDITIVEAESSFIDCRIVEPGRVSVSFRNVRNPVGIFPSTKKEKTIPILDKLECNFTYLDSVIEAALHNPNLIVHTVGAIMSIPRIEKTNGDYCMYWEVFTPSVWNILEKLDKEKMDVLEELGCERLSYVEACKYRNSLDDNRDAKEVFMWYAAMPTAVKGPTSVNSRYITEDVSQGLVMLESFASIIDVKTPVCSALINIANAALNIDFRLVGRNIENLGKNNIDYILSDKQLN